MSVSIQMKDSNNKKMYPHPYYPIGSIYLSVNDTNPTKWFSGRWELIAQGRTLVGVDTNDTDFSEVKKTGGEKETTLTINHIPKHDHDLYSNSKSYSSTGSSYWHLASAVQGYSSGSQVDIYRNNSRTTYTGGGQAHNNLPPYFTCYIWCRIA